MIGCKKSNNKNEIDQLNSILSSYNKEINNILRKIKKLKIVKKDICKYIIKKRKKNVIYEKISDNVNKKPIKLYDFIQETIYEEPIKSIPIRQRGVSAPPIMISPIKDNNNISII